MNFFRLTGMSPFHGKSYNEILIKNKNCEIKFNIKAGHPVSDQGNIHANCDQSLKRFLFSY